MSTQLATVSSDLAKMRFREPYVSEGLNKKFFGPVAPGIVRGGYLTTSLTPMYVEIQPDPTEGDSVYTVSDANGHQLTVRQTSIQSLDLTALQGTTVYLGLKITYVVGSDTVVEWRAYSKAEVDALVEKVAIVGKVVVPSIPPPAAPIPAGNITLHERTDAWQSDGPGNRDWFQITENGSSELPTPGIAGDRQQPYLILSATGAATIDHSNAEARTGAYSVEIGGTTGDAVVSPEAGGGIGSNAVLYPVKAGQKILYSFYAKPVTWTAAPTQEVTFFFRPDPISGAAVTPAVENFTVTGPGWERITGVVEAPADGYFQWFVRVVPHAANVGNLYIDDIRVWVETGDALEDPAQSYLRGLNREVTAGSIALVPSIIPDNVETWADSIIRVINTSPADGSAISAKVTADPLNDVDTFEVDFKGTIKTFSNNTFEYAVYGNAENGGKGGVEGRLDGSGVTGGVGVYGNAFNQDGSGQSVAGVAGLALQGANAGEDAHGVSGTAVEAGGVAYYVGVSGFGDIGLGPPTVKGVGGVFWGDGASEPSYWTPGTSALFAGVVGIAGPGATSGVEGWGAEVSSGTASKGGYFRGGDHSGSGGDGARGIWVNGGDTSGDGDSDGGQAIYALGGDTTNAASTGAGGHGVLTYGGDAAGTVSGNGGRGVSAFGGDAAEASGGVSVYGEGGDSGGAGSGGAGGYFLGGDSVGGSPGSGVYAHGGEGPGVGAAGGFFDGADANGTGNPGGHGVFGKGGNRSDGTAPRHGHGGYFQGATASGPSIGVVGQGQFDDGYGGAFENDNADHNTDAVLLNSGIKFAQRSGVPSSQNPDKTETPDPNVLKAVNVPKFWAIVKTGASKAIEDGFGVNTTITTSGSNLRITLRNSGSYDWANKLIAVSVNTTLYGYFINANVSSAAYIELRMTQHDGTVVDLTSNTHIIHIIGFAKQTLATYNVHH
jgi:hypothetical protein